MFKEDDDEEDNTFGVTRYPCMPSLVALQQMRNRLHLANLGKKLMKWTAVAAMTELRNIALQIDGVYKNFSEDMCEAFIMLARCRYFNPSLNEMVLEGCPNQAEICVTSSTRTASGVKIVKYSIIENNTHPYEHLGIGKGGQMILDTKKAWLELLKRIILMVELRKNFKLVEEMQKSANKQRKNIEILMTRMARYSITSSSLNEKQTYNDLKIMLRNNLIDYFKTHKCTKSFIRDVKQYYKITYNQKIESFSINISEDTTKEISNFIFYAMEKNSSNEYLLDFMKLLISHKELCEYDIFKILLLIQNYFTEYNFDNRRSLTIDYVKENRTINFDSKLSNTISSRSLHFENNQCDEIKNLVLNLAGNICKFNNGLGSDEGNASNGHGSTIDVEDCSKLAQYFSSVLQKSKNCYDRHKSPVLLPITTYFSSGTTDLTGNEKNKQILMSLLQKIDQTKNVAKAFTKHCISRDIENFINACVTLSDNLKKITEQNENGRTCLCEGKCETCGCVHSDEESKDDSKDDVDKDNKADDIVKEEIETESKQKSESNIEKNNISAESSGGYFERKVKTSKIKRFTNSDGTVREEIETTIVTEKIHDPVGDIVDIDRDDDIDLEEEEVLN